MDFLMWEIADGFLRGDARVGLSDAERAAVGEIEKGGPGSGCQGPNCGRPKGGGSDAGFKLKAGNAGAWQFNAADPVNTRDLDDRIVEKFSIDKDGRFVPVSAGQMHASTLRDGYDQAVRVIQDPKRRLVFMHFSGVDQDTYTAAREGNPAAWAKVRGMQIELADRLYGKHPGTRVILASGGPEGYRIPGSKTGLIEHASEIPANPAQFIDKKYLYTV